ncbi:MAG: DUF4271 domain-containing protein [Bacteroidota bacterium]
MRMWAYLIAVCWIMGLPTIASAQVNAKKKDSVSQVAPAAAVITVPNNDRSQLSAVIDSLYKNSPAGTFTIRLTGDSAKLAEVAGKIDTDRYGKVLDNPFFPRGTSPRDGFIAFREKENKDTTFYLITGILLLLAIIRIGFPSYFSRLFQFFFQTSTRQRQTRDRLLQEQFAAIGLNLLFFVVMGTFVTLLAFWRDWYSGNFWLLWGVATGFLCLIYAGKFIFLRLAGWIFKSREAMRSYTFIVFLVNKLAALLILPLLILVAFSAPEVVESAFTIGLILVAAAFVYRYAISFTIIRNKMGLNAFHFFLYFISLEIIPLLVILKLLFRKLNVII